MLFAVCRLFRLKKTGFHFSGSLFGCSHIGKTPRKVLLPCSFFANCWRKPSEFLQHCCFALPLSCAVCGMSPYSVISIYPKTPRGYLKKRMSIFQVASGIFGQSPYHAWRRLSWR